MDILLGLFEALDAHFPPVFLTCYLRERKRDSISVTIQYLMVRNLAVQFIPKAYLNINISVQPQLAAPIAGDYLHQQAQVLHVL